MSALRILIVDDEAPARERLADLLGDLQGSLPNEIVDSAGDGLEALAVVERESEAGRPVDVALVDIRMPKMGGLELAGHLATRADGPAVVFLTAFDQHAVQAFELNAIDYLLKPIRAERLLVALRKAADAALRRRPTVDSLAAVSSEPRRFLPCLERGRLLLVPVADIVYLRADAKYVAARTAEREYLLDEALLKLEVEFGERFLRLHRSVLVARDALAGFERASDAEGEHWVALLRGVAERLPVSRRQWPLVREFARALTG